MNEQDQELITPEATSNVWRWQDHYDSEEEYALQEYSDVHKMLHGSRWTPTEYTLKSLWADIDEMYQRANGEYEEEQVIGAESEKVTRYTRAGSEGKDISCPECRHEFTVYHFSWSQIVCGNCKQEISKTDCEVVSR
jgi:ribosomal protein S27E